MNTAIWPSRFMSASLAAFRRSAGVSDPCGSLSSAVAFVGSPASRRLLVPGLGRLFGIRLGCFGCRGFGSSQARISPASDLSPSILAWACLGGRLAACRRSLLRRTPLRRRPDLARTISAGFRRFFGGRLPRPGPVSLRAILRRLSLRGLRPCFGRHSAFAASGLAASVFAAASAVRSLDMLASPELQRAMRPTSSPRRRPAAAARVSGVARGRPSSAVRACVGLSSVLTILASAPLSAFAERGVGVRLLGGDGCGTTFGREQRMREASQASFRRA